MKTKVILCIILNTPPTKLNTLLQYRFPSQPPKIDGLIRRIFLPRTDAQFNTRQQHNHIHNHIPTPPNTHTYARALFTPGLLGYVVKPTDLIHKLRGRNCCVLEGIQANKHRNQDKSGRANPYPCTVF